MKYIFKIFGVLVWLTINFFIVLLDLNFEHTISLKDYFESFNDDINKY